MTHTKAARIAALVGLLLSLGSASSADPVELPTAEFRVVVSPKGGTEAWVSEAFEKQIYLNLAKQSRLIPTEDLEASESESCGERPSLECLLESHRAQGIQIFVSGEVDPSRISYDVFDTDTQRRVASGSTSIQSPAALGRLKLDVSRATTPFLEEGGLIEQSQQDMASAHTRLIETLTLENSWSRRAQRNEGSYRDIAIKALAALFLVPMLAVFLSRAPQLVRTLYARLLFPILSLLLSRTPRLAKRLPKTQPRTRRSRPRLIRIWFAILALAGAVVLLRASLPEATVGLMGPYLLHLSQTYSWVLFMLGGMTCAWLLVVNLRFVISPVPGIETSGTTQLGRLLQSWTIRVVFRSTLILALHLVFLFLAWLAATAYGIRADYLWLVAVPFCALLTLLTLAAVLENISFYLDSAFVEGDATSDNPWHDRVTSYLEGFHGPLSEFTFSNILFLPGRMPGVITYGGTTSSIRVVIDHRLLELGLGTRIVNNNDLFDGVEYDFLLGLLHLALGRIHQGHHVEDTLSHWIRCLAGTAFDGRRRSFMTAHEFLIRPLNHSTVMSDAFAALNGGLHQLIQFLYLDLTERFRLLTTRGHSTDLNANSREIFSELETSKSEDTRSQRIASRIAWLSQYTDFPMAVSKRMPALFVFTLTAISIGFLSLTAYAVTDAFQYHPTYVERIDAQSLELEQKIAEMEELQRKGTDDDPQR